MYNAALIKDHRAAATVHYHRREPPPRLCPVVRRISFYLSSATLHRHTATYLDALLQQRQVANQLVHAALQRLHGRRRAVRLHLEDKGVVQRVGHLVSGKLDVLLSLHVSGGGGRAHVVSAGAGDGGADGPYRHKRLPSV